MVDLDNAQMFFVGGKDIGTIQITKWDLPDALKKGVGILTADAYLSQYRTVQAEIIQRNTLIKRMKQEIFGGPTQKVTAAIDAMMGRQTAGAHWDANDLERFKEEVAKQEKVVEEFRRFLLTVTQQICKIEREDFRIILMGRYIHIQSWEEIADLLKFSVDYTKKEQKEAALNAFAQKFSHDFYKVPTNPPKSHGLDVI